LLGISGMSSSPKPLLAAEDTNPRARAALELYVRRIVREIGALVAVLGGLDMLAFTAGVGEHSAILRERICGGLQWLGLDIDDDANRANATTISAPSSRIRVAVEPTNEEWIAACHAQRAIRPSTPPRARPKRSGGDGVRSGVTIHGIGPTFDVSLTTRQADLTTVELSVGGENADGLQA
jgi:hypothetical protein